MMSTALDTNVLVRFFIDDDTAQVVVIRRLVEQAEADGEPLLVTLCVLLELWAQHPSADFADCLLAARTAQLGRSRFATFDAGAAKLPRGVLLV
jgi:predicted nucleic-acid-binding protein